MYFIAEKIGNCHKVLRLIYSTFINNIRDLLLDDTLQFQMTFLKLNEFENIMINLKKIFNIYKNLLVI